MPIETAYDGLISESDFDELIPEFDFGGLVLESDFDELIPESD